MRIWLSLSLLMSVQAFGAETLDTWREQKRESLTWSTRGVIAPQEGLCQHPAVDCRKLLIEVRNDHSDAPIYCGGSILFPEPNAYFMRQVGWPEWIPVQPGQTATVNSAWVPKDLEIKEIYTECRSAKPPPMPNAIMDVTDKPPQPPPPPDACSTKMKSAADPDNFYPPAAKAEQREGAPILRATIKKGESKPDSVELVTSSGHADIDEAAIQVAKASRYSTTCESGTVKFKVKFFFREEPAT